MSTEDRAEFVEARADLEAAVKRWLKVKAQDVDPDDQWDEDQTAMLQAADPILLGFVLVACYTSVDLEKADATGYSYEAHEGQPAAFSRGLSLAGVDRWAKQ